MQSSFLPFRDLLKPLVADMAQAISVREGEPVARHQARMQTAVRMIMAFFPRDLIEAMLAGRCVMFHELTVDSIRRALIGEATQRHGAMFANIVALDRCFSNNLKLLEHYQARPSDGERDAEDQSDQHNDQAITDSTGDAAAAQDPAVATADTARADAVVFPPASPAGTEAAPGQESASGNFPSRDAIDAVLSNPEAMAAMEAGDAAAFARAFGFEPCEEYLAAAAQPGSPFDPAAWGGSRASGNARAECDPAHPAPEQDLAHAGD